MASTNRPAAFMLGLALAASGCSLSERPINPSRLGPPYRVETRAANQPMTERPVPPASPESHLIRRWLDDHASGWQPDLVSYVPTRRIKGETFDLNFVGEKCVLNYQVGPGDRWVQVSRPLEPSDTPPAVFDPGR